MNEYLLGSVVSVQKQGAGKGTLTISIPSDIREKFDIERGDRFAIYYGEDGSLMYRKIEDRVFSEEPEFETVVVTES
ncbi:AbrB/MazE/SpoVT family DNA-binding domain-containing protein [Bacteroides sp.]|uniref:AbrB/MazE/SpoVT family DNA-binding domain-containing protein n=1 Tax=Bacteroides sp. TaxID=29523 RepID=UPI002619ED92|nr:AbrB/MazE/SpoVT family DNA-binding domain-containing protein [Bacteroides sp.]MDD3039023.1 AbrB/MazE/SpoVT family DNA-binding domain-containing protein [Bacteroides sp.]